MKKILKGGIVFLAILFFAGFTTANCQQIFDKSAYYNVMKNANIEAIDQQIKIIEAADGINKEAYTGALLMKKAGIVAGPSKKLNVFKTGHKKLEAVIEKEKQNAEWRFLRLLIQEHAPKIVNYRGNINEDAVFIQNNFKKLSPEVQAAVLDYRKHSNTLQSLNF
jgi:hypothetical protein